MARKIVRLMATRHSQAGNTGKVIVVVVVMAALLWWKWDLISSWLGSTFGVGGSAVVEVVDYHCDPSGGRVVVDGRVRNASDAPIGLRAVTAIYYSSGGKSDYLESAVRPSPLAAGQVGDFRADGPPLPEGGYCKLDGFIDSDNGRPVRRR
jgi:hypothetical protein